MTLVIINQFAEIRTYIVAFLGKSKKCKYILTSAVKYVLLKISIEGETFELN